MGYEILEHTADEKFRATGETIEEAFAEAVKALSDIVGGGNGEAVYDIEVESENREALFFDFLDQLIQLQDTEGVMVSHAEEVKVEEAGDSYRLEASILVDPIDPSNRGLDIKGPTYSEMVVDYGDGEWVLQAVLDV